MEEKIETKEEPEKAEKIEASKEKSSPEKAVEKVKKKKKCEAVVNGKDIRISTKHSIALCNFIKGRKIEEALALLEEARKFKRAIPMKGEIPHRKGMMSGRYPINAINEFIKLLKELAANANVNEIDLENSKIQCNANRASKAFKRFGSEKFKRTHVNLKLIQKKK